MADGLSIDDPEISVTLEDGDGSVVVTMRNGSDGPVTPRVVDPGDDALDGVAVQGAGEHCAIAVESTSIEPQTTEKVSISFAGCESPESSSSGATSNEDTTPEILMGGVAHEVEFESPAAIAGPAIGLALLIGLVGFVIVLSEGHRRVKGKLDNVLVDPPAVFSVKDGWLTNLTTLSAAAIAIGANTDVADTLLGEGDKTTLVLLGLIVVALLGLSPIVISMATKLEIPEAGSPPSNTPSPITYQSKVALRAYVWAAAITAGTAIAQLSGFGWAAYQADLSVAVEIGGLVICAALAITALLYATNIIGKTGDLFPTIGPTADAPVTMARSLVL